ncbi:MAG: ATP-binding protein [Anaerolineae bacterium]|nr:ATP-binding protein [Anaerolineae bacterium]
MSSLMDRLMAKRHQRFVGRSVELELFQAALTADEPSFIMLYIYGPGGFGKTTLLNEYYRLARERELPIISIDARNFDATPDAFQTALRTAMEIEPTQSPIEALGVVDQRVVLLIDTFEQLFPIESWLRDIFLPRLSENVLIVGAGRAPLASTWYSDPGWQDLIRTVALRNLTHEESHDYLVRRGIPEDQHEAILAFAYGHPLALSLMADTAQQQQLPNVSLKKVNTPDMIRILVERFVKGVPSSRHRIALEACALVRLMNEPLLAQMLDLPDAFDLFDWLRNLSFVEIAENGIYLQELTREVLVTDLRWRNPEGYMRLHQRARDYYFSKLRPKQDSEQARLLYDLIYLHKDNPAVRAAFDWQQRGNLSITELMIEDVPVLLDMVRQHEGEESAHFAHHWFERQPNSVRVLRDSNEQAVGFIMTLTVNKLDDLTTDPAVAAVWQAFNTAGYKLRSGENILLFRFWMGQKAYQTVSPEQTNCFIVAVQYYLTTPGLAYTYLPVANPDFWFPVFSYANLTRLPEADFNVGGRHYGMYGHDWRAEPPSAWLDMLSLREVGAQADSDAPPARRLEPTIVLSQEEFEEAIVEALKSLLRPDELVDNPLLRSRLVIQRTTSNDNERTLIQTLQNLIRDAAEVMKAHPRDGKYYQALHYTYFHPAPTQEQAAEILDLPFSTFRRHLKNGITRIAEILWQQEVGGIEVAS